MDVQTNNKWIKQTGEQTDKQMDKQTDKQTNILQNGQTDKQ